MNEPYRTLALVPSQREHLPKQAGEGTIPTTCKPPGWWRRFWMNIDQDCVWTCWCDRRWIWKCTGSHIEQDGYRVYDWAWVSLGRIGEEKP